MWGYILKLLAGSMGVWLLLGVALSEYGSSTLIYSSARASAISNAGPGPVNEQRPAGDERWRDPLVALESCSFSPEEPTWDQFFDYVQDRNNCSDLRIFGGKNGNKSADGSKGVCFDLAPRSAGCLVLSFGINNEWSFDDAMADLGCNVYSFDPTMGVKDHQRSSKISFHSLGLSGTHGTIWSDDMPVDTYRAVLEHIGMINRTVDYLKIDIEGSEINFFENVLFEDPDQMQYVKQIGMEIHVDANSSKRDKFWEYFARIKCLGFKMVSSERNTHGHNAYLYGSRRKVSKCYELVWLNEAFL